MAQAYQCVVAGDMRCLPRSRLGGLAQLLQMPDTAAHYRGHGGRRHGADGEENAAAKVRHSRRPPRAAAARRGAMRDPGFAGRLRLWPCVALPRVRGRLPRRLVHMDVAPRAACARPPRSAAAPAARAARRRGAGRACASLAVGLQQLRRVLGPLEYVVRVGERRHRRVEHMRYRCDGLADVRGARPPARMKPMSDRAT